MAKCAVTIAAIVICSVCWWGLAIGRPGGAGGVVSVAVAAVLSVRCALHPMAPRSLHHCPLIVPKLRVVASACIRRAGTTRHEGLSSVPRRSSPCPATRWTSAMQDYWSCTDWILFPHREVRSSNIYLEPSSRRLMDGIIYKINVVKIKR